MTKKIITLLLFISVLLINAYSQDNKQDKGLKRVVTLYNPYKPSLSDAKKMSFLPDMTDTLKIKHSFKYDITAEPFMPVYNISPLKAAALLPDPLQKLYKSYINIGLGNYFTPLAEISITSDRSKSGAIGLYGRHFSSNGDIALQNGRNVFDGFMDNDAALFGRKFFSKAILESSVSYTGRTRYAYGYDTSYADFSSAKKDMKMAYSNIGAKVSLHSTSADSTDFSYDVGIRYNYFQGTSDFYRHNAGISVRISKEYMGFKIGSGFSYDYYRLPDTILPKPEYIATLSPFVTKRTGQWDFRAGFQAVIDKNMNSSADFHFYPDLRLGFSVVPSYVNFYAGLSGKLERNDPLKIIGENPYLLPSILFTLPNTDHALIFSAGVNGNDAIGGDYLFSASYSLINNLLLYSNIITPKSLIITPGGPLKPYMGNHFLATAGDAELLNIHGEMSGTVTEKISFKWDANIYKYSLSESGHPWNKPAWDAGVELKYNLRNKILAGAGLTAIGKRWQQEREADPLGIKSQLEAPAHVNLNFNAEYRYSKVLSFWAKINNISPNRYYEWAYYPTQGLLLMAGFTYSL